MNATVPGYKGRMVVHELMIIDDDIRALIMERSDATAIKRVAISKGMVTLRKTASKEYWKVSQLPWS